MPEKPDEVSASSKGSKKGSGVRKLHYIVHLDSETDQVIKVEEMDEATNTTREMPLPLFLDEEGTEPDAAESEESMTVEVAVDFSALGDLASGEPITIPLATPKAEIPLSTPKAHLTFSTPKADSPPSTPKAFLTLSTPKADSPPSTPKAFLTLSTPKADSPPSTPKADSSPSTPKADSSPATPKADSSPSTPKAHLTFSTPKADSPPSTPKAKSAGFSRGTTVRKTAGPCLRFRFKPE